MLDPSLAAAYRAARRRGAAVRHQILSADGGTLTTDQAAQLLGLSRLAVRAQIAERRLLSVPSGSRTHLIPAWQFRNGQTIPGLHEVLAALPSADPWRTLLFFVGDCIALGHRRPLDVLLAGGVDAVVTAARAHGAGGR